MTPMAFPSCTRREALGKFVALLAAGLWPGTLRAAAGATPSAVRELTFVAANDFHYEDAGCDPWFEKLFRQIATHREAAFCLGIGDLANHGKPESVAAIKRHASILGVPFYPVPGNHDNDITESPEKYVEVYPDRLNYAFMHAGWQFVGLDTTDGQKYQETRVQPATLAWLDHELPKLDPARPTVLFTHFPLAAAHKYCPLNAEEIMRRFIDFNLRIVLGGHFHGRTTARRGRFELVTNACCARVRHNHDGSTEKGYLLCRAQPDGTVEREFVLFEGPATPAG